MRPLLFILFVFLLNTQLIFSQGNIPMTISTPRGNITTTRSTYAQPHLYMIKFGKKKKKFTIKDSCFVSMVLQNDSLLTIYGKFNFADGKQTIAGEGKSFTPSAVKELYVAVSEEESITGVSKDTCWLFKTTLGYISAYGKTPEIDATNIVAIQKSKEDIMPFSKELLIEWIKSNEKAVKLAEKGKYLEAIKLYNL